MDGKGDIIDSQITSENVKFLDCFENSFMLHESLAAVKEYLAEESGQEPVGSQVETRKKLQTNSQDNSFINTSINKSLDIVINKQLSSWGLPPEITRKYSDRGIQEMFPWQVNCLSNSKVLMDNCNLVYSAPTSAGKTLVAEILTIKTVLERQKKVIIILPFVSIVREKMFYLQDILSSSGIRVEGFMGSQSPPGGLQSVHVAICTIEKANSLVNKLLDDGSISELGTIVVDEMHLLGDPHRGYILELLLTKIKYVSSKQNNSHIQIIGMSATLPNLDVLANWLDAELFVTQFRPIPLEEYCLVGKRLYDCQGNAAKSIEDNELTLLGFDEVFNICFSTLKEGCSVLIFCMTKNRCESLAQSMSMSFYKLGCSGKPAGVIVREQLNSDNIMEVLEQLQNCPVGLDGVLKKTISFGVAYHHAGLTFDERDIIEGGFKSGALRVLVATSTLSSGVNLPARKVIIRSPVFLKQPINILTYKQMIGRAGRMGKDTKGESYLICTEAEKQIGIGLMMSPLEPVNSCIDSEDKFMRAILEMIASEEANTPSELELYSECTLLFKQGHSLENCEKLLDKTLTELMNYELVRSQNNDSEKKYTATSLGKACLSSSMAPNDGLSLFLELQRARQCLVLENDLHLIYLVTPYSVSSQWGDIDWLHLLTMWESLTKSMKKVGELVGIQESFIVRCVRGNNKTSNAQNKMNIHKRFYTALALKDLVNEVPLSEVAAKFQCPRGFLQSLQQAAATFAGMVTVFCHQLGWKYMELLISQFQDRLHFGIHSELVELMRLPLLNGLRARSLFNSGFETIVSIASANIESIEKALLKAVPFESEKQREGDDNCDIRKRNKIKSIWITGCCGLTARDAAENLIAEARQYLQYEIGVENINWENNKANKETSLVQEINESLVKSPLTVKDSVTQCHSTNNKSKAEFSSPEVKAESSTNVQVKSKPKLTQNFQKTINNIRNITKNNTSTIDNSRSKPGSSNKILIKTSVRNQDKNDDVIGEQSIHKDEIKDRNYSFSCKDDLIPRSGEPNSFTWDSLNLSELPINTQLYKTTTPKNENFVKPDIKENNTTKLDESERFQWDTINFSEIQIPTLAKIKSSPKVFSPDISFSDNDVSEDHNDKISPKSSSGVKDLSLFSSEGENSSIFEDSLPIEDLPSKLFKMTNEVADKSELIDVSIPRNTVIQNTSLHSDIILDDDEDIKLVYEEENLNINKQPDLISADTKTSPNKKETTSTKRQNNFEHNHHEPDLKRLKTESNKRIKDSLNEFLCQIKSSATQNIIDINSDVNVKCCILKQDSVLNLLDVDFDQKVAVSFLLKDPKIPEPKEIIGSRIINKPQDNNKVPTNKAHKTIAIAVYFGMASIFYLDLLSVANSTTLKTKLTKWFQRNCTKLKVVGSKSMYVVLQEDFGFALSDLLYDIGIAYWLIHNNEDKEPCLKTILQKVCNKCMPTNVERGSIQDVCLRTWAIWNIAAIQESELKESLYFDYETVLGTEFKISKILATSEYKGIDVDKELAARLLSDTNDTIEILQRKAFKICGQRFNMNSSKTVAKMLGIYKGKKVSTKKSVLTAHDSALATCIIYWRKLNAILTKTLYPLTEKAVIYGENNRVRSTYNTFTCTGRVTMHEPNLQNVPRTFSIPCDFLSEDASTSGDILEFNCRNIFKASSGSVFVSADYCQLEMRILTHFCEDPVLMNIMKSDMDVFKSIAASWGNVPEELVDDDLRQKAKQLCYGIIYGMGNKTLGATLDVSEMEAAVFMDTFHKTYPKIKIFINDLIDKYQNRCYIETLMKRRRHIPDLKHRTNASIRQAVNSTIQGSAADIVKAVMCEINNKLTNKYKETDWPILVLQMHDELVYEVPERVKPTFVILMKSVMENTIKLKVPLPVKMKSGYTWGSLTELRI